MKIRLTFAALLCLLLGTVCPLNAQYDRLIDWVPEESQGQRYTVSVQPLYLLKHGLKFDFEKELRKEKKWLQIGVMGYYTPHKDGNERETLASSYDGYNKMIGGGLSVAYKTMLGRRGFHYNFGLLYNFYNVDYEKTGYLRFVENGLTFYEYGAYGVNKKFHQPAAFINIGKHMALSRHVFVDMFMGLGFMYSFQSGERVYKDYCGFGYRGFYFNGGVRLGVMWNCAKKNR